jgi:hypothetical protein
MPLELIPLFGMMTGTVTVAIIAWTVVKLRRMGQQVPPRALADIDVRLGRIEQAIDAMSVEVERISEGQRFTSKLLAERAGIGAGTPRG